MGLYTPPNESSALFSIYTSSQYTGGSLGTADNPFSYLFVNKISNGTDTLNNVETWTFTLSDGTTTTKKILVG